MSKELEALDVIVFHRFDDLFDNEEYDKNVNIVEEGLERLEATDTANSDYKTAFELINEKRVDIKLLHWAYPSCEAYNVAVREKKDSWPREELTPDEFEFLGRLARAK